MSSHIELVGSPDSCSNICSGHYMVSNLDDCSSSEEDDLPQTIVEAQHAGPKISGNWRVKSKSLKSNGNSKQPPYVFKANTKKSAVVSDRDITHLAKLFDCLRVYSEQLTTPRWNNFRSLRLSRTDRIRLNNLIWREFYTQHIRFLKPVFVKFEAPSLENHQRPRSVVLEGKYWKRRFDSVCVEYLRWRCFYKLRLSGSGYAEEVSDMELLEKAGGHPQQNALGSLDDAMDTEDLLSDLVSNLEWLLDGSMTTAGGLSMFPSTSGMANSPPDVGGNTNADIMQPLLLQMTSNLEDSGDLLQNILASPSPSPMPPPLACGLPMPQSPPNLFYQAAEQFSGSAAGQMVDVPMEVPPPSTFTAMPTVLVSSIPPHSTPHQVMPGTVPQAVTATAVNASRLSSLLTQPSEHQRKRLEQSSPTTGTINVKLPPGFTCVQSTSAVSISSVSSSTPASTRTTSSGPVPTRTNIQPYSRKEPYAKRRKRLTAPTIRTFTTIAPKPSSLIAGSDSVPKPTHLPRRTSPLAEMASPMASTPRVDESATINCQRLLSNVNLGLREWRQSGLKTECTSSSLISSVASSSTGDLTEEKSVSTSSSPLVIRPLSADLSEMQQTSNSSEGRRRCSINQGLVTLHSMLPEGVCSGPGAKLIPMSKAMILLRSAEYIRELRKEIVVNEENVEKLRHDVEKLQQDINECCSKLPATGLPMPPSSNDKGQRWFRAYIRASTLRNSKFYIFSLISEKLFSAYTSLVSMSNVHDFTASVMTWLEQRCSMICLREYVRAALMKLSTKTSILTDPSLLPEESLAAVSEAEIFSQ